MINLASKTLLRQHTPKNLKLRALFSVSGFDPYIILGVTKSSTEDEIKKAYIKKVKESHPDVKKDDGKAFKLV